MIARRIATLLVKRPKTVLLVYTIITIIIGLQISNVYMQSDLIGFLPPDDPSVQLWNQINREFKVGSTIIVFVTADDIRDPEVLKEMDRVATTLNPYDLDKGETDGIYSVTSIAQLIKEENSKTPLPGGLGGSGEYSIPEDPELISTYFARLEPMEGTLFLNTYKDAVIIFQVQENADYSQVFDDVNAAIEKYSRYADMAITGTYAVQKAMREQTFQSLTIVFVLAIVLVSINIYLFHRDVKSFIIAFLPLGYSLVLTFGVLGLVHPELTILTIAAAALLIGLGDDYSVYYSSRFAEEYTAESQIERVERTLKRTGKAVLMCAVATMIGFGSLMTSSMPPMVAFGFVCLIGAMFVFLTSTILVPCLCLILKFQHREKNHKWIRFSHFVVDHRKRLFAVGCFFVILSLLVLPQVKTDVNYLDLAPTGLPEVQKLQEYAAKFGEGVNFNALLVQTDSQGLTSPDVIDGIYRLEVKIRQAGGSAYSIADEIKKVNDILDRSRILEKIVGFVGIDKLLFDKIVQKGIVDDDYSKTLIVVSFPPDISIEKLEQAVDRINTLAMEASIPSNGRVSQLAGQDVFTVQVNQQIMSTQLSSMITELLLILACLIIGFGSTKIGFMSMLPVLFVLAWEPGFLVVLDIPLSIINISVAAIVVSTGIDYGIVFIQRIREERMKGSSKVDAMKKTIETSGWSIVTASSTTMVALLATFAVNIPILHQFSIIVILLYACSVIACFFILPTVYASKFMKT